MLERFCGWLDYAEDRRFGGVGIGNMGFAGEAHKMLHGRGFDCRNEGSAERRQESKDGSETHDNSTPVSTGRTPVERRPRKSNSN